MTVDPARAAGHVDHKGTTYHFCSKGCVAKFSADPEKYLRGEREAHVPTSSPLLTIGGLKKPPAARPHLSTLEPKHLSTSFTCPMHPEVVSDGPGACPYCGMAL